MSVFLYQISTTAMAPHFRLLLFSLFLIPSILFLSHSAKADDAEEKLLQGINSYRASINLSVLIENKNADCLAGQIANQFENQPCTNTTGANTVPGTENQFPNFPQLLAHCHLNVTNTRDGVIMPACVPNLDSSLVLSNFTQSQYSENLNSSQFTGVGIAAEEDWIVVVLSTNTSDGSYATATNTNAAGLIHKVGLHFHLLSLLLGLFLMAVMS
ncbi:uncharacterized GPI-anchored protein At5g19250 [Magnolia sinica]|uniref:uncharacterized GPI-anchored protein At5g19250 n=1 Tax=Magnolia sinica TaxID=86752 RepID=UPI00265AF957|nr:uncharacterized GPI-anchored protein At5g19250 [Magnolia sinica]